VLAEAIVLQLMDDLEREVDIKEQPVSPRSEAPTDLGLPRNL
jgi:hypothetical protein